MRDPWRAFVGGVIALWIVGCSVSHSADGAVDLCSPTCSLGRRCCRGACINPMNDPRHCGGCDIPCGAGTYCTSGRCEPIPCTTSCSPSGACCGGACCAAGEICCDPQGPVETGPRCMVPDARGTCPVGCAPRCICASPDTPIATPLGERPIAELAVGDLIFSVDDNAVVAVPIERINRTAVFDHHVVRVTLASGAVLEISAGHPTADGRTFGDLEARDQLGGVPILAVEVVPYTYPYTYDVLPRSDSGAYFASGALVGSTLAP
jgi:hypothetical protein